MRTVLAMIAADRLSGPLNQLVRLADQFRLGNEVRLVFACTWIRGRAHPPMFEELRGKGHEVRVLEQRFPFDPLTVGQAARLVRETRASVLQTHGYKPNVIGFAVSKLTGIPWVAFIHGDTNENAKVRLYFRLERFFARHADRIVAVCEAMRDRLVAKGFPGERTVAVYNALQANGAGSKPGLAKRDVGLPDDSVVMGVVGRLSPEKGQEVFLKALAMASDRDPRLGAVLVGDGQEEASLRALSGRLGLDGRAVFAGYQKDVAPFYALMNILVIPSFSEGMPNVALEAMAHRLPVAASRVGGVPETVLDGHTGRLVPPGDAGALADAMLELAWDPEKASAWGMAGYQRLREEFSPEARAGRMMDVYCQAAVLRRPSKKGASWRV